MEESTVSAKVLVHALELWCVAAAPSTTHGVELTGALCRSPEDADPALVEAYRCVHPPPACLAHRLTVSIARSLDEAALSKKELVVIETLEFKLLERHPYEVLETVLQGTWRGACLRTRVPSHAGAADASLGQYTTKCYALVNDTYRYTDLCMLQPPEVRRSTATLHL